MREEGEVSLPPSITVYGYAPMELGDMRLDAERLVEEAMERLDEEFGDPNADEYTRPHESVLAAAKAFLDAIKATYQPWMCECVTKVEVDPRKWITADL